MHFRTFLLAAVGLAAATAALAQPNPLPRVRIASGPTGQTYREVYAPGLASYFARHKIEYLRTAGSAENLELLAAGKADVAFAQADVYAQMLRTDEPRYQGIEVIGRLADECLYVARRKDGSVTDLAVLGAQIDGRAPRVATGPEGGGAHWTWQHLVAVRPDLAAAEVSHTAGNLALNQLEVGMFDAAVWVTDPANRKHPLLRGVLGRDTLSLLPIEDVTLEEKLPSGLAIYEIQEVLLGEGPLKTSAMAPKLKTLCTSAVVFARSDAEAKFIDRLSDAISLHRDAIVTRPGR